MSSSAASCASSSSSSSSSSSASSSSPSSPPYLLKNSAVLPAEGSHLSTIIWMHGLGDSSEGFRGLFKQIKPKSARVILPNAPVRPVTINGGMSMQAWYDIFSMDRNGINAPAKEDELSYLKSSQMIEALLAHESKLLEDSYKSRDSSSSICGSEKIILGGFSQGAAMTLYVGFRSKYKLAGLIAASGYVLSLKQLQSLSEDSTPFSSHSSTIRVYCHHGIDDGVVPVDFALQGYNLLKEKFGMKQMQIQTEEDLQHSMSDQEIAKIRKLFSEWVK